MSTVWIKICGMTTPEAVDAALAARVDAIGFVFAASPRRVTAQSAARLAAPARGRLRCIAVTRHPTQSDVDAILTEFKPDVLQTDHDDLPNFRLPRELELLPVLREDDHPASLPARLLLEGPTSGIGVPCDWHRARALARHTQLVLAGGLTPENVASAIAAVRPFGVDVSSGVETLPGVKDPARIARFAAAARQEKVS